MGILEVYQFNLGCKYGFLYLFIFLKQKMLKVQVRFNISYIYLGLIL